MTYKRRKKIYLTQVSLMFPFYRTNHQRWYNVSARRWNNVTQRRNNVAQRWCNVDTTLFQPSVDVT